MLHRDVWLDGRLEQHLGSVYRDPSDPVSLVGGRDCVELTYTKLAVARAAGRVSRASGRGGGTAAPGRLLLRMAPKAIRTLGTKLHGGTTLVSATNGKTTTARMLAEILAADGRAVVHNREGANTHFGVCTALADGAGDVGVFEVDEAWLPLLARELQPRLVVLGNLSRDRLDGYGELDRLHTLWRAMLSGPVAAAAAVVNADDPVLSGPGGVLDGARARAVTFGVADEHLGSPTPEHPHEGHSCLRCGCRLQYARAFVGHAGRYRCPRCSAGRPTPLVAAADVHENGFDGLEATILYPGGSLPVRLALPGLHNLYNALAATTAAWQLGASPDAIQAGFRSLRPPFGRGELLSVRGREVRLLLVKNPVAVNQALRLLAAQRRDRLHLWIALNDEEPDGRDVSWIWDADFERLAGAVAHATCSGRRAAELALRLKYAGWTCPLHVDQDLESSFTAALERRPAPLHALPTYTALLGLRSVLKRLGTPVTDWDRGA